MTEPEDIASVYYGRRLRFTGQVSKCRRVIENLRTGERVRPDIAKRIREAKERLADPTYVHPLAVREEG